MRAKRKVVPTRVPAYVAAAAVAACAALFFLSAVGASADANPNNRGHHYGQIKHHHPGPNPQPSPTSSAGQPPTTKPPAAAPTPPAKKDHSSSNPLTTQPSPAGIIQAPATVIVLAQTDGALWVIQVLLAGLLAIWLGCVLVASGRSYLHARSQAPAA